MSPCPPPASISYAYVAQQFLTQNAYDLNNDTARYCSSQGSEVGWAWEVRRTEIWGNRSPMESTEREPWWGLGRAELKPNIRTDCSWQTHCPTSIEYWLGNKGSLDSLLAPSPPYTPLELFDSLQIPRSTIAETGWTSGACPPPPHLPIVKIQSTELLKHFTTKSTNL